MSKAYQSFSTRKTPQDQPFHGSTQIQNSAGGYAWAVNDWVRLDRFLILGSEGGTYYIAEQKLTAQNATAVIKCIESDGLRTVNRIAEISEAGRAAKNDPALFCLAMCASLGNSTTKKAAFAALPSVARTGTHLFHFLIYVQQFRGWGRGLRNGVANWYQVKDIDRLAYQVIKYRQRDGWTHRDALRSAHPVGPDEAHDVLYHWITQGQAKGTLPDLVVAYQQAQAATDSKQVIKLIVDHNLPREALPTQFLNDADVWDALLQKMPMTAMIRNLGKMTSVGLLKPMSAASGLVVSKLKDAGAIKGARVHPIAVLTAMMTYSNGHGTKGNLVWSPVGSIVDALDAAFYLSFGNVVPTNKNTMIGLDISGSMTMGDVCGVSGLSPRVASAALSLVTANVESNYAFVGFSDHLIDLHISPRQRLDDVVKTISGLRFGRTDCALPMVHALNNGMNIEAFVIYTDSETWFGKIHPSQALQKYRQVTSINAKLAVVGMVSNGFSIADPNDAGMMDVVGMDTATPNIISDFIAH